MSPPKLTIRAVAPEDAEAIAALMNQPGVRWGTLRLPFTRVETVRKRLLEDEPGTHRILGVADGAVAANAALHQRTGRQAHVADIGLMVGDDHVRKGYGRAMLGALLTLADDWLGLTRVELEAHADNAAAIALYEAAGFEREGVRRAASLRSGVLVDSVVMGRLRPAPRRQAPSPAV